MAMVGKEIAHFQIEARLGLGGMGVPPLCGRSQKFEVETQKSECR
jgi:hypothetical protein